MFCIALHLLLLVQGSFAADYYKQMYGTNRKCENTGNAEHGVASHTACEQEAVENEAPFYSYVAPQKMCFYSTTCSNRVTGTSWEWLTYEAVPNDCVTTGGHRCVPMIYDDMKFRQAECAFSFWGWWCATEVDGNKKYKKDKWGYCKNLNTVGVAPTCFKKTDYKNTRCEDILDELKCKKHGRPYVCYVQADKSCGSDVPTYNWMQKNVRCSSRTIYVGNCGGRCSDSACRAHCDGNASCDFYASWDSGHCETYASCPSTNSDGGQTITLWQKWKGAKWGYLEKEMAVGDADEFMKKGKDEQLELENGRLRRTNNALRDALESLAN